MAGLPVRAAQPGVWAAARRTKPISVAGIGGLRMMFAAGGGIALVGLRPPTRRQSHLIHFVLVRPTVPRLVASMAMLHEVARYLYPGRPVGSHSGTWRGIRTMENPTPHAFRAGQD